MGEKHAVRLEPVGIDFEVDEDETVLNAAFRQGLMLMHGCKEGQCGACKSFLLDGEVDLERYSTFALPDYELEEGWTLLCRAHAVSIRRLVLTVVEGEMPFRSGQYVDIGIPGTSESRSFSMANLPSDDGRLEFMIKLYPGGRFSTLLAEGGLQVGDELDVTGPYGTFTLRDNDRPLLFVGGGAGMAPILSLLRSMADRGVARPAVYYYGAREEQDLFHLEELAELQELVPGLRFVPALSDGQWDGETGLITDVVERCEPGLDGVDAYLCGPPPMVEAAQEMLMRVGVDEAHIHYDKFTTTATTEESSRT
jgi:propane monooxygenase reductase subunit